MWLPRRRWLYPLALLLVLLLIAFAAPVAHAQSDEGAQEPPVNDTTGDADQAEESAAFEDEAGQVYGASILLAMIAIGIVIAVVLVKQHWRHRGGR